MAHYLCLVTMYKLRLYDDYLENSAKLELCVTSVMKVILYSNCKWI
jgi:hypothetical protein